MRLRTGSVLLAVLAGCSGTGNTDQDAGVPSSWNAGYRPTDYPNGMRTWLKVFAPDRVEEVLLAGAALAMETSDAGTVWAQVPRDQPEGLTEVVVRGAAPEHVSKSPIRLAESGVYQWSTFFIGGTDECGFVLSEADRIVAVCVGGNVLDTLRFERGGMRPSTTARQFWLHYRYTLSAVTVMASRRDLPLVATFTGVGVLGPPTEFRHTAVKEVAIDTVGGDATVLSETTFPEFISSAVYWRSAAGTWLLATAGGGLLGWQLDSANRLPLVLDQPLRFGSPVAPLGKVTAVDTDGDGQDELFITGTGRGVAVYEGPSPDQMVLTAQTLDAPFLVGVDLRQYVPALSDLDGDGLTDAVILGNGAVDVLWREPGGAWTVDRSTFTPQGADVILEGPVSAGRFGRAGTPSIHVDNGGRGRADGWLFAVEGRRSGQVKDFDWGAAGGTWERPYLVADFDFDGMNDVMVGVSANRVGLWRESAEHVDRHGPDLPDVVIMGIEDIAVADGGP